MALLEVVRDLIAEHRSLHVGGAEVDAGPDARIDDLSETIREPVEVAATRSGSASGGASPSPLLASVTR